MDREPKVGDKVVNRQTGELGTVTRFDDTFGIYCYYIEPDDPNSTSYWEAIWNLEIDPRIDNS